MWFQGATDKLLKLGKIKYITILAIIWILTMLLTRFAIAVIDNRPVYFPWPGYFILMLGGIIMGYFSWNIELKRRGLSNPDSEWLRRWRIRWHKWRGRQDDRQNQN